MFTDLFIKYKRKYSALDKRINLIKEQILNKIHIFLFLLNKIYMWDPQYKNDPIV